MQASNEGHWHECFVDADYEINDQYPHDIRRKGTTKTLKLTVQKGTGYLRCMLNGKYRHHHRLVALQFIPNDSPAHKIFVAQTGVLFWCG